ncbi:hypothetical protein J4Q44_G00002270 [Coregonus suidteri]|uniref:Uncharacterized protein n=1 Tax=Coregonus suidteri TaxID=861788 RepID=A0AAN8R9Y5_9TELE
MPRFSPGTAELQYGHRKQRKGGGSYRGEASPLRELQLRQRQGHQPLGQRHKDTDRHERPSTKENTPPPPLSQSQSSLRMDLGSRPPSSPSGPLLLSSVATERSLREVWQILDRCLNPSIHTPGELL